MLGPLAPWTNGSPSGTRAIGAACRAAAISSLSGHDVVRSWPFGSARLGTVHGVQPTAESTARSISPSSLPFASTVAPFSFAALAGVFCAVLPFAVERYVVVVLSDWSWSTMLKSRVVGHGLPSLAVPSAGTTSFPALIAWVAASKNASALQKAFWPKIEPSAPLTQERAPGPLSVTLVALKPTQIPT